MISGADSKIDVMAPLVESAIRANKTLPKIRYMGKFSTSPNFSTLVNTAASTHIMSSGLSTDHSTPSTLRRYFNLKSLDTREEMVNQFLRMEAEINDDCAMELLIIGNTCKGQNAQ